MGLTIAQKGLRLVYGAGSTGLMGAVADGALEGGGEVIGVIPEMFNTPQLAHKGISRFEVVPDMHTRKARIVEISDGFVALPGGFGTLEEFFEVLTWAQIGLHTKPVGLLNTNGYYDLLIAFLDQVEKEGFMYSEHKSLYLRAKEPDNLLAMMAEYQLPAGLESWVERG
jgi:uncharacterized protein (TIGR00730 family)